MSYRYEYSMSVTKIPTEVEDESLLNSVRELSGYDISWDGDYSQEHQRSSLNIDEITWNNIEEDLTNLSLTFPESLFTVDITGEEWDDRRTLYVKNGKSQSVDIVITYPEPDEYFQE
jgi:hypothetical protein